MSVHFGIHCPIPSSFVFCDLGSTSWPISARRNGQQHDGSAVALPGTRVLGTVVAHGGRYGVTAGWRAAASSYGAPALFGIEGKEPPAANMLVADHFEQQ